MSHLRLSKLQQRLHDSGAGALLLFDCNNIRYLTGFSGHAATLLLCPQHGYLITDYRYMEQAEMETAGRNISVLCRDRQRQSLADAINELLLQHAIDTLAFESEHISVAQWQQLQSSLRVSRTTASTGWVEAQRYVKDRDEINAIKQAAHIADQALSTTLTMVKQGVSERDLAIELDYQMARLGSPAPAFDTILLFGERSAMPHGLPGTRRLRHGDLMLFDFGAQCDGYRSDMTRSYVFGAADQQQRAVYQTVLNAQQAALAVVKAGISGELPYQQAAEVLNASEFHQYQGEGLGHGVGLVLHEQPFLGKQCTQQLQTGCVITIEPGIYIPGWGGVRIEDDVLVTRDGAEILNRSDKNLLEL